MYREENLSLFRMALLAKDWKDFFKDSADVTECFENFIRHVRGSLDLAFPLKNFQCKESSKKTWITGGISKSRENLLRIAENTSLSKDEAYHLYFKNYRRI